MKRVKTIGSLIIVLLILSSALASGCFTKRYSADMVMMYTQVFHAVPGTRSFDKHVIEGEITETDEYGRIQFSFYTGNIMGVCIMQKHDDKYVYYYDNVCYLVSEQFKEPTVEELDYLREINDWNQPLDESKMIERKLIESTLYIRTIRNLERKELLRIFYSTMTDNEKYMTFVGLCDSSQTGQDLYFVSRTVNMSTTGGYEYVLLDNYFMILNADGSYDPENYIIKFESLSQSNAPLAEIKERNEWVE